MSWFEGEGLEAEGALLAFGVCGSAAVGALGGFAGVVGADGAVFEAVCEVDALDHEVELFAGEVCSDLEELEEALKEELHACEAVLELFELGLAGGFVELLFERAELFFLFVEISALSVFAVEDVAPV